eukprot:CAMPEP_0119077362 /NCGR_PEP_ID=MMETSP1178-20130426/94636_1 /TAXON_ID=33656 /ORGANISM="unid sp, Strain CCMP2000" /LENGTH=435 /DNA_ID=CAMNT_0007059713 /DNA_START=15 /DNA_END=1322 /DNA_ORIENTATION=+
MVAMPPFDVSEAPVSPASSSSDTFVFVDHVEATQQEHSPASCPNPEWPTQTLSETKRARTRGMWPVLTATTAAVFVMAAASLLMVWTAAAEQPHHLLLAPPTLPGAAPASQAPFPKGLPCSGGERAAGHQLVLLPSPLRPSSPSPQPVAGWLLPALLVLVLVASLSCDTHGDGPARAAGTRASPLDPEPAPFPSPLVKPAAMSTAKPTAKPTRPKAKAQHMPHTLMANPPAAAAIAASPSPTIIPGSNRWNTFQRLVAQHGFTPAEVSTMYRALREAKTRKGDQAATHATSATAAATVLTPMTASRAQRCRPARPAALPTKLELPRTATLHAPSAAPALPASPGPSPTRRSRANNPWNAFQRAVGGRGFSQTQVCDMYTALKKGKEATPSRHLSWNGFQQLCGGKGYTKETLSQMYASCKSAERYLFEEAASRAL